MVRFSLSSALAVGLLALTSSASAQHTVTCAVGTGVTVSTAVIKDRGTPGEEVFEFECANAELRYVSTTMPAPRWVTGSTDAAFTIEVEGASVFDFLPGSNTAEQVLIDSGTAGAPAQKVVEVGNSGSTTINAGTATGSSVHVDCSLYVGKLDLTDGTNSEVFDCDTCAIAAGSGTTLDASLTILSGEHGTCAFTLGVAASGAWSVDVSSGSSGTIVTSNVIGDSGSATCDVGTASCARNAADVSIAVSFSDVAAVRGVRCGDVGVGLGATDLGGFVVRAGADVGQVMCDAAEYQAGMITTKVTTAAFRSSADGSAKATLLDSTDTTVVAKAVLGWVVFKQADAQTYGVFTLGADGVNHEVRVMGSGVANACAGETACVFATTAAESFALTLAGAAGAREYGYFDCGGVTAMVEVTAVPLNVVGDSALEFGRWVQAGVCEAVCAPADAAAAAAAAVNGGMRAVAGSDVRCVLQYDAAAAVGVQVSACDGTVAAPFAAAAGETVLKACGGALAGDSCMRAEYADNAASSGGGAQFYSVMSDAMKCASAQVVRCSASSDVEYLVVKGVGTVDAATASVSCAAGVATVTGVGGADVSGWAMGEGSVVYLMVGVGERLFLGAVSEDADGKAPELRTVAFAGEGLGFVGGAAACDGTHACVVEVVAGAFVLQWSDEAVMSRSLSYVDCTRAGADATFEVVLRASSLKKVKEADVMFTCGAGACGSFVDGDGAAVRPIGAEVVVGSDDGACVVGYSAIVGSVGGVFGCKAALAVDDAVSGAVTVEGDGCVADSGSCVGTATAKSSFLVFEADTAVCESVGGSGSKSKSGSSSGSGSGSGSGSKEKEVEGTIGVDGEFFIPILGLLVIGGGNNGVGIGSGNFLVTPDSNETVEAISGPVVPKKVLKSLLKALKKAQKRSLKTFNKVAKAMQKAGFGIFFAPVCVASCTAVEPAEGDASGFEVVCFGCGVTTGDDVDATSTVTAEVAGADDVTVTSTPVEAEVVAGRGRSGVVAQGGGGAKPVVICAATTPADQVRCFERAACAGLVTAGAAECSVSGVTRACPECPDSSSSKKGLLGLLGLLALIPLCLLCLGLVVCCLVLKKRSGSSKAASMAAFSVTTCPMPSLYPSAGVVCGSPMMTSDVILPTMPLPTSPHMHTFSPHCAGTVNTHLM